MTTQTAPILPILNLVEVRLCDPESGDSSHLTYATLDTLDAVIESLAKWGVLDAGGDEHDAFAGRFVTGSATSSTFFEIAVNQ